MSIEDHRKVFLPLRDRLRQLYHSRTPAAMRFQYAVIVVDLAIIAFPLTIDIQLDIEVLSS
jgi:voltage-gated potassium channel